VAARAFSQLLHEAQHRGLHVLAEPRQELLRVVQELLHEEEEEEEEHGTLTGLLVKFNCKANVAVLFSTYFTTVKRY